MEYNVPALTTLKRGDIRHRIWRYRMIYLMMLPGLLFFLIYRYLPMFGIIIAFKKVSPAATPMEMITAPWVGLTHFRNFFNSFYFWRIFENTLRISLYGIIFGFPAPIMFALLLNELRFTRFKKIVQTISYMPHFLSMVIVAALVQIVFSPSGGIVNEVIKFFGGEPIYFLATPQYFRSILVGTGIWQGLGWGSILYIAAITGIDPELYDAACIDGANRWRRMWHITLPGMSFIITLNLILNLGYILDAGFERVLLLYTPVVYGVGDIIDTYVFRVGLIQFNYSLTTAVGLFKSVVSLILIIGADRFSKKIGQRGIW